MKYLLQWREKLHMKIKKFLRTIIIVAVLIYVSTVFIEQQKSLIAYKNEQKVLEDKIQQQKEYKEELLATKENLSSPEYIEQVAREKLDMYLPNERVYIDIAK